MKNGGNLREGGKCRRKGKKLIKRENVIYIGDFIKYVREAQVSASFLFMNYKFFELNRR